MLSMINQPGIIPALQFREYALFQFLKESTMESIIDQPGIMSDLPEEALIYIKSHLLKTPLERYCAKHPKRGEEPFVGFSFGIGSGSKSYVDILKLLTCNKICTKC